MTLKFFNYKIIAALFLLLFISFSCYKEEIIVTPKEPETVTPTPIPPVNETVDLFKMEDLPEIKLTVPLKDWNLLLSNYDINPNNNEKVVSHFQFELNGKKYLLDSIGIRIKGNTSRKRPEKPAGQPHNASAPDWSHCHFALDFNKFKKKQSFSNKKALDLKWFKDDSNYAREIYCYDLFERFGVWTAPQASYCKLTIHVQADSKPAYYGVYAMVENLDEEFISTRTANWSGNVGFLWKGGWENTNNADLVQTSSMGVQEVNLNASLSKYYAYDLKTREDEIAVAKSEFIQFINDLNYKSDAQFKTWIKEKMDVSLFLKTYAVNVMVGMWDDYWVNGNNYYFYFAGNGKAYFIPYDYDNTLGTSQIMENSGTQNPLTWGKNKNRPLITRIMAIPEFKEEYKGYLKQLVDPTADLFDATKSMNRINQWKMLIQKHIDNDTGEDTEIIDQPADWGNCSFYRLNSGNADGGKNGEANYFKTRAKTITW